MKTGLLIRGRINDFIPIGQDGQPIYLNAEAFRSALSIHPAVGEDFVKMLAVPRVSDDGSLIDWYIPFNSSSVDGNYRIIPWLEASADEKAQALTKLHNFEIKLKKVATELIARSSEQKSMLFAHYLTGQNNSQNLPAIHFPENKFVYIVNGTPVITFWGFVGERHDMTASPFAVLQLETKQRINTSAFNQTNNPFVQNAVPPETPIKQGHQCVFQGHKCILPILGLVLLLALLLWWLWPFLMNLFGLGGTASSFNPQPPQLSADAPNNQEETALTPSQEEDFPPEVAAKEEVLLEEPSEGVNLGLDGNAKLSLPSIDPSLGDGIALSLPNVSLDPSLIVNGSGDVAANGLADPALVTNNEQNTIDPAVPVDPALNKGMVEQGTEQPSQTLIPSNQGQDVIAQGENTLQANNQDENAQQGVQSIPSIDPNLPQGTPKNAQNQEQTAQNQPAVKPVNLEQPLSYTPEQLQQQGAKLLNGSWATSSALMDSTNGKPIKMQFDLKDGKGQVVLERPNGDRCYTSVNTSIAGSSIVLSPKARARCGDSSSYKVPEIKCNTQADGSVKCNGMYDNAYFPINMYKQ